MHSTIRINPKKILFGVLLSLWAMFCYGQKEPLKSDVRLVIDVSGSMKINDPNNLRQPAVDLLVRLLPEGSKAGVWTFGKYVNMLVPHRVVDQKWRDMARAKAKDINSVGLFTNIGGALEKAAYNSSNPSSKYKTSVILLTDGMVDISKFPEANKKEWRRIVDKVLPELQGADFTLHTVALSKKADTNLLEKLAVSTDGTSAIAHNAEDLMKIFLKAFDVAAPTQQVPLEDNTFAVDSSVEEFTALIFRMDSGEDTQLVGPDKEVFNHKSTSPDVSWLRTSKYDLITVKRPIEGEWKIQANIDPDSRITVVSDMRLQVKTLPNNVFKGDQQNLSFVLKEDGKVITRKDFLSLLKTSAVMAYGPKDIATSQVWFHEFDPASPPQNGVFHVAMPELNKMGVYDIELVLDGQTFKREFTHRITAREPFTASLEEGVDDNGMAKQILTVRSHSDAVDAKKTQIAATIVNPKRRKSVKPLGLTEFDHWQALLHADMPGEYRIVVKVTGKDIKGEPFEYTLTPLKLKYNPDALFEEVEEPVEEVVEPEPEPEVVKPKPPEPVTEPVVVELPEPEEEPAKEGEEGLPSWLMYVVLAVGNMVLLGGGYFLFKKLTSGTSDDVLKQFDDDDEEPAPEPASVPVPVEEPEAEEMLSMADADEDEEEPPMEDLDSAVDTAKDDEMDMAQAMAMEEAAMEEPPIIDDAVEEDDFGVDDLEDDSVDAPEEAMPSEEHEDLEAEMLKAQGLDLAEDELDDAINNLIDELDESRDVTGEGNDDDGIDDLAGIDFEDDDK